MAGRIQWSQKRLKVGFAILLLFFVVWILAASLHRTGRNVISSDTNAVLVIDYKSAPLRKVRMDRQEYTDGYKNLGDIIQLATVICGNRLAEATVMLKSAVLFTRAHIHMHIFIEDHLKEAFVDQLNSWPAVFKMKISIIFHEISYPPQVNHDEWRSEYRPCSTQRIFLPDILPDHDAIMYVDTDMLFLRPLDEYWRLLRQFNYTQIMAITSQTEPGSKEVRYSKVTKFPFYGEAGLNTGVILMNLTRMRTVGLTRSLIRIYQQYKSVITLGDQDVYNIYCNIHPDQLFLATCAWNWRHTNCQDAPGLNLCHDGIAAFHAWDQLFHTLLCPPYKAVYDAFENWALGTDVETGLIKGIQERLSRNVVNSNNEFDCSNCTNMLLVDIISEIRASNSK